jgi:hypothetical protein
MSPFKTNPLMRMSIFAMEEMLGADFGEQSLISSEEYLVFLQNALTENFIKFDS